jgi:Asp-tRNA(Asn)/Glu-tRNA(Gln) amidotransferase A subunit family amidase
MIISEYGNYDGLGLAELVRRTEVSPADLVESAIDAIERLNPKVNCVVQKLSDLAMAEIRAGLPYGPFRGVPFLVKEFGMHFKGMVSSAGSRLAAGFRHEQDSVMMQRCRAAGLVVVGTSTLPEMAFNAASEALLYGPRKPPDAAPMSHLVSSPEKAPAIPGTWTIPWAAHPVAPARRSDAAWCRSRMPTTVRDRSAARRPATAWSA